MIFTAAKNNMIQNQTRVNVFLGNKMSHNVACDFHIEGSWSKRNCVFFSGNTSTIIAQVVSRLFTRFLLSDIYLSRVSLL
ncbi:putative tubby-like protein [Helianthus anomalus]